MTGLLSEKEFSRKTFLKGGGALIVGFSVLGAGFGATAKAGGGDPFDSYGPYDPQQIDSWIAIHADNTADVKLGKVELGQGAMTGLLMIAAEELDLDLGQVKPITNDTNVTPDQGITAGSSSIRSGGMQTRAAAAAAKQALLGFAATKLGVPAPSLSVSKGVVSGGGKTVTYGELIGDRLFNVTMPAEYKMARIGGGISGTSGIGLAPGAPGTKPASAYGLVGKSPSPPRVDIPAKVAGTYTYVHNVRVPGMLHGRVVRPRGQGAYPSGAPVLSVDESSIRHLPGVKVVRKGDFVGVVASREYDAIQAAAQLKVKWADPPVLPGDGNLFGQMRKQDTAGQVAARTSFNLGDVDSAFKSAAHVVSATYSYHYNGHLPIGPSCAVADVTPHGAVVYSNTQNAYATRSELQSVLPDLPLNKIRVIYYEGSSVYGSSPYNDCACAAAVMSQLTGAPVRVQFMRWDEHGWDNYGPAQLVDVRGAVDAKGNLVATDYTGFQIPYYTTDVTPELTGAAKPVVSTSQSADTSNTGTQYNLANRRVTTKVLPLANNYFKTIYLRAPLAPQSLFAYEQLIDELAHAAKLDPVQFRLQNITNNGVELARRQPLTWNRWKNVLTEVARLSKWQPRVAASGVSSATVAQGRGIALGGFAGTMTGIVADVEVNKKTGKINVKNLYGAQDTGLSVYPGGIENQASGSMTQGASRALYEEVTFDKHRVTSLDWVGYPIMRFKDHPNVTFSLVQRFDIPSVDTGSVASDGLLATGSGEPPTAPIAAAIANAFFDATGVRIREAPMTPARVRAVLKAATA
jgi:CO/xanthine dehydrogenase Mo-binding subunit